MHERATQKHNTCYVKFCSIKQNKETIKTFVYALRQGETSMQIRVLAHNMEMHEMHNAFVFRW